MILDLSHTAAVVLAAGRGSRMKAKNKNKVAFRLGDQPMIARTVTNLQQANISNITVVVGFQADSVIQALQNFTNISFPRQELPLGTADAVKQALPMLGPDIEKVLIVSGDDSAFYPTELYNEIIAKQESTDADIIVLTLRVDNPQGLGRIIEENGHIQKIVEEKVASEEEKKVNLINTSMYCIKKEFLLQTLPEIQENSISKEYYLTDLIEIAVAKKCKVISHELRNQAYWHGVNNRSDFARARAKLKT